MSESLESEVKRLREEVSRLRAQLEEKEKKPIQPREQRPLGLKEGEEGGMGYSDDNPYSRLMALKRMGIVENYERIRDYSVAIVGVGGVGSVTAEMLTRCGIGCLCLFDLDIVQAANMNRLFYRPEHIGLSKVEAAKAMLLDINPDVAVEAHGYDITTVENYGRLCACLSGTESGKKVDLVLSCVDNYGARITVNQACNELNIPWIESGVSENAMAGHVQLMVPGRTACFQCAPPLIVASEISESTLKRDGVCAASLPTTMGLVAALLAQAALKYLLGFAPVSCFLGYNAFSDFFPRDVLRPNPECTNEWCRRRQQEAKAAGLDYPPGYGRDGLPVSASKKAEKAPVHESNEWGIEVVETSDDLQSENGNEGDDGNKLAEGIAYAYEPDKKSGGESLDVVSVDEGLSIDDLAEQLKALK